MIDQPKPTNPSTKGEAHLSPDDDSYMVIVYVFGGGILCLVAFGIVVLLAG